MQTRKIGEISLRTIKFHWRIENYSKLSGLVGSCVVSPVFHNTWLLEIYPNGQTPEDRDRLVINLRDARTRELRTNASFSVLDDHGAEFAGYYVIDYRKTTGSGLSSHRVFLKSALLDRDHRLLVDDALTIVCEIKAADDEDHGLPDGTTLDDKVRLQALDCYATLLESQEHSDFAFVLGGKRIPVHKNVLAARSTVFASMFAHDMVESKANEVEIKDIEHGVFLELLRFVYAGKVENIERIASDLLIAADRYLLEALKSKCANVLAKNLSAANVLDCLPLTDTYDLTGLKARAIQFVRESDEVVRGRKFEEFTVKHPKLAIEITRALMDELKSKKRRLDDD